MLSGRRLHLFAIIVLARATVALDVDYFVVSGLAVIHSETAGSALAVVFVVDMADSSTTELADKEFCVVLRLVCGAVEAG